MVGRRIIHSSPEFLKRLKQLQGKIKAINGEEPSITELTNQLVKLPDFDNLEKQLIDKDNQNVNRLKIKFD
jgi:hypothetical protein